MQGRLRTIVFQNAQEGNIGVHFVTLCLSTYTPVASVLLSKEEHMYTEKAT